MARSDLLLSLVKASAEGNERLLRSSIEAMIAEERGKQHNILADKLEIALKRLRSAAAISHQSNSFEKSREFLIEITPQRRLEDLLLSPLVTRACYELIEEQQRADLLRAHSLEPRHRLLLVGPPGNGKTSLAEGIAESLSLPFFVVRYETMIGSYLGETASRLKGVFDYARTRPCVLFFDEFDALGKERGDKHETGEIKRVVTSLLMQIDELPSYAIVIAATNHAELLDRAVWRRFQLRLELTPPSPSELAAFIKRALVRIGTPVGVTAENIAKKLGEVSYSEAEQFCLDVMRRQVLALGEGSLKSIVGEQLNLWAARKAAKRDHTEKLSHARPSATKVASPRKR